MFSRLRWRKTFRDLWRDKLRSILVVLCLILGASALGIIVSAQAILNDNIEIQVAATNLASAVLTIPNGFGDELLDQVRSMPEVAQADGVTHVPMRIKTGLDENEYANIDVYAYPDYSKVQIYKVRPEQGAWPPADSELLVEKTTLRLDPLRESQVGDTLVLENFDGKLFPLPLAGLAYDFSQEPSPASGRAYGYVTPYTLVQMGYSRNYNELRFIVSANRFDEDYIRRIAHLVSDEVEKQGYPVDSIYVPVPGKYTFKDIFEAISVLLNGLGFLSLGSGVFLIINTITALLAQQVRQIGVMKAVGARTIQIAWIYVNFVLVLSVLALLVALPLSIWGGDWLAGLAAYAFNIRLEGPKVLPGVLAVVMLMSLAAPLLAGIFPIIGGTRVTVLEALNDYGLSKVQFGRSTIDRLLERIKGFPRPIMLSLRNTFRRRGRLVFTLMVLVISGSIFMSAGNIRASLVSSVDELYAYRKYDIKVYFKHSYPTAEIEKGALSVPGITHAESFYYTANAYRLRPDGNLGNSILVLGISPDTVMFQPNVVSPHVITGEWLSPADRAAVVVNDVFMRAEKSVKVGDTVTFKFGQKEVPLKIAGVIKEALARSTMYINYSYISEIEDDPGNATAMWALMGAGTDPSAVAQSVEEEFRKLGLAVARLDTKEAERGFVQTHVEVITVFLQALAVILVAIGGLGLMGTMSINVIERRREVGVMRAIGASDTAIQQIFIVESVIVGLISWVLSIIFTVLPTKILGDAVGREFLKAPLRYTFAWDGPFIWLLIVVVVSIVACYWPARKATQVLVRELLAYE